MLPSRSATRPCGPSLGPLSGNSFISPVLGSRRPSLLTICSVNQSEPSGPTAGSCGWPPLLGMSHSRMVTWRSATVAADLGGSEAMWVSASAAIEVMTRALKRGCMIPPGSPLEANWRDAVRVVLCGRKVQEEEAEEEKQGQRSAQHWRGKDHTKPAPEMRKAMAWSQGLFSGREIFRAESSRVHLNLPE